MLLIRKIKMRVCQNGTPHMFIKSISLIATLEKLKVRVVIDCQNV